MIDHVDEIDWTQLGFPRMPMVLRALAFGDDDARNSAFDELYDSGLPELTTVAPKVIPFLIELLNKPDMKDKRILLLLLMQMASAATVSVQQSQDKTFGQSVLQELQKGKASYRLFISDPDTTETAQQLLSYLGN